jgi:hypothetical protein
MTAVAHAVPAPGGHPVAVARDHAAIPATAADHARRETVPPARAEIGLPCAAATTAPAGKLLSPCPKSHSP